MYLKTIAAVQVQAASSRSSTLMPVESPSNFLLVINSNVGRICYRFGDIGA